MDTSLLSRFMPRIAFPWAGRAPTVCAHCFFFGLVWAGTKGLEDGGSGGAAGVVNRKYVVVGVYSLQPQCRRQRRTRPRRPCLVSRAAIFVLAALCVLRESVETADLCVCVCVCSAWLWGEVRPGAYEISQLLDTGLDKRTLATIMGLCENGVNPEALAYAIKELRRSVQGELARDYR